uniref:Protein krueppel n=1 Tax=Anopheles minimus TaxID=112268 RepID=A0A182W7S2_9DIPT
MSLLCRICLEYCDDCAYLFTESNGVTFAEIIQFCANIQISEDDDLPSQVCLTCCEDAEAAYIFVKKCRQSEHTLQAQKLLSNPIVSADISTPHIKGTAEARTEELLVELVSDASHTESTTQHMPDNDDIYADEYLDEMEIENFSQDSADLQSFDEDRALTWLENRSECDSSYFCCYSDCILTFHTKRVLKDHISIQHPPRDEQKQKIPHAHHNCDNCDQTFSSEKELGTHELLLQLKKSMLNPASRGRPKAYPCLFNSEDKKCCDCYASFPTIESLLEHTMQRHSIRKTVKDPTRTVRCVLCFKLFRSKSSLYAHQNAPYKPRNYTCNECGASFLTPSRLSAHETAHSTERKFKCTECEASFKNEQNLNTHALLHREKKEVCSTCGLRFHRKSNLRMHQRVHSDAYYTACPHCDKKCKNQSQLKEHLKVHTKEKTLACRYCAKRFMYTSDRKRHEMIHTGKYPFTCGCSKKFSRNRLYMRHKAKCTAEQE